MISGCGLSTLDLGTVENITWRPHLIRLDRFQPRLCLALGPTGTKCFVWLGLHGHGSAWLGFAESLDFAPKAPPNKNRVGAEGDAEKIDSAPTVLPNNWTWRRRPPPLKINVASKAPPNKMDLAPNALPTRSGLAPKAPPNYWIWHRRRRSNKLI